MKVKVEKDKNKETAFPCLMKSVDSGVIVLMIRPKYGMIVSIVGFSPLFVGYTSSEWDMGTFKLFDGKITLEND